METEQSERLTQTLAEIRKRWGVDAIRVLSSLNDSSSFISTGFTDLNELIGGGIPCAQITELVGAPTCGLIALLFQIIVSAQSQRRITVYIDLSRGFDPSCATQYGIQLEHLLVARPDDVESALDILQIVAGAPGAGLIVLDNSTEIQKHPLGQGKLNLALAKAALLLKSSGSSVVMITPHAAKGQQIPSTGLRLHLQRMQWQIENGDVVGCRTKISVLKRRRGGIDRSVEVTLRLDDAEEAAAKRAA